MPLEKAYIPYGAYWSTPFCRWQGALAQLNSIELAARTGARFIQARGYSPKAFDGAVLGLTVQQFNSFYGTPWLTGMMGLEGVSGPTVSQACATSVRALATAAAEVETGAKHGVIAVTCDRTSNGPHVYYPDPSGIGGTGKSENVVWDSFNRDPYAGASMLQTAENVAKQANISRQEQDHCTLVRYAQYNDGLKDDRAFQRRYMFTIEIPQGKKAPLSIASDEGVFPTTAEGLAGLRPAQEGGSVTFGSQTHPADGNAGMVVCDKARAAELSKDKAMVIRVVAFGDARVEKSHMPKAVAPAARQALAQAGITIKDCAVIKTHNPFAVNDVLFGREMGIAVESFNNYGSPLVYGHPQGPTGSRAMIEMIEELVMKGGGYGLFSGCAAGDTAMAAVIRVN